jgi:replication factor C subunit 3/5
MEKYVRNARFCLICNYVSKIIPALQSRCTRFRFQPLPEQFVRSRLEFICINESVALENGGLDSLVVLGEGDMRRTLNLLQSTAMSSNGVLSESSVYSTAGKPLPSEIKLCAEWLLNDPVAVAFQSTLLFILLSTLLFIHCSPHSLRNIAAIWSQLHAVINCSLA